MRGVGVGLGLGLRRQSWAGGGGAHDWTGGEWSQWGKGGRWGAAGPSQGAAVWQQPIPVWAGEGCGEHSWVMVRGQWGPADGHQSSGGLSLCRAREGLGGLFFPCAGQG